MNRGNVFSGSSFRATLYGTLFFVVILALVGFSANRYVSRVMRADIREQVGATIAELQTLYDTSGAEALSHDIDRIERVFNSYGQVIALYDQSGNRIAGRVRLTPDFDDWVIRRVVLPGHDKDGEDFYLTTASIGADRLVIGHSLERVQKMEATTLRTILAVGAVMTLVFITIGYQMSRTMQMKLEKMADTLEMISEGHPEARLPVSTANDQIDRMSRIMNTHLGRLSELMVAMKYNAAAIAHDLKRPLARAFLGLERAISKVETGTDPSEDLEEARRELSGLSSIFETILRIARIDAGQSHEAMATVDLAEIATELGETFEVVAEESGQSLRVHIDRAQDLTVQGDAGMLSQLIVNLLQNAVSHCPAGTAIALSVRRSEGRVCLEVTDTGPGIPEADRDKALETFFRSDSSRSTEGSGLGLALVKSIADKHRADLRLSDNHPGLKVTVCF